MKNSESRFVSKFCLPCQSNSLPIPLITAVEFLQKLEEGWNTNDQSHLRKEYKFDNFINFMSFSNKIAQRAEQEAHHPNLYISWGICIVEIWTHKIKGLSENDFILAAKIDNI